MWDWAKSLQYFKILSDFTLPLASFQEYWICKTRAFQSFLPQVLSIATSHPLWIYWQLWVNVEIMEYNDISLKKPVLTFLLLVGKVLLVVAVTVARENGVKLPAEVLTVCDTVLVVFWSWLSVTTVLTLAVPEDFRMDWNENESTSILRYHEYVNTKSIKRNLLTY